MRQEAMARFCGNCGNELNEQQDVCLVCGKDARLSDNPKSKIAAGLLGLFFGTLGIHNFYLGYTVRGLIQLVLTIIGWSTAFFIIGLFIIVPVALWVLIGTVLIFVALWVLIGTVLIFIGAVKDAKGYP
jgi:TM2 domain-containing membrane protein YozV